METVNSFWHGRPLGHNQKLTIKSYLDNGHPFHLWVYDLDMVVPEGTLKGDAREVYPESEIFQLVGGIHNGSFAFFADQFLMKLLPQVGQWWVGMDATCLKPLPAGLDYMWGPHWVAGMGTHVLKVPKGDPVLTDALAEYRKVFRPEEYDYLSGLRLIYKMICKHGLQHTVGTAEEWGDDPLPYDEFYLRGTGRPPETRIVYHWCHSLTKHREANPEKGSFYYEMLTKHGVI